MYRAQRGNEPLARRSRLYHPLLFFLLVVKTHPSEAVKTHPSEAVVVVGVRVIIIVPVSSRRSPLVVRSSRRSIVSSTSLDEGAPRRAVTGGVSRAKGDGVATRPSLPAQDSSLSDPKSSCAPDARSASSTSSTASKASRAAARSRRPQRSKRMCQAPQDSKKVL